MTDSEIVQRLGGFNTVSKILGYNCNAVHNWTKRGISAFAKFYNRKYFMPASLNEIQPLTNADKPKTAITAQILGNKKPLTATTIRGYEK